MCANTVITEIIVSCSKIHKCCYLHLEMLIFDIPKTYFSFSVLNRCSLLPKVVAMKLFYFNSIWYNQFIHNNQYPTKILPSLACFAL
jgi:hypothetical protein